MIEKKVLSEKLFRPFHSITNTCISSHFFFFNLCMLFNIFVADKFYMKGPYIKNKEKYQNMCYNA